MQFQIGKRPVGEGQPCFIIAEAGNNHQGDVNIALQLVDLAHSAGADSVKFQKRCLNRILTAEGLNAPYDSPHAFGDTYGAHREALELGEAEFAAIARRAEAQRIIWFASAWDEESVDFLERLGAPAFKIPSADLTNVPLIEYAARKGRPVILSTGMSTLDEVDQAVAAVRRHTEQFALLQCTSTYPSEYADLNLRMIPVLKSRYQCVIGYSGHERGIAVSAAAVALGASIVERHFTIDRTWKGSDHAASLEHPGLQKLVRDIRNVELALGRPVKTITPGEVSIRRKLAKSLVSAAPIPAGAVITAAMLTAKGPGTGLSPSALSQVAGRRAVRDIPEDVVIQESDLGPAPAAPTTPAAKAGRRV